VFPSDAEEQGHDLSLYISAKKRYLQLDEEYSKAFHGLDQLIVVAEGPALEETKAFVRLLGERLKADTEHVQEVFYQIDASCTPPWNPSTGYPAQRAGLKNLVKEV